MTTRVAGPPGWWRTVWILLAAARRRAVGRRRRQAELLNSRLARAVLRPGIFGGVLWLLGALGMSGGTASLIGTAVQVGQELAIQRRGLVPADSLFINLVANAESAGRRRGTWPRDLDTTLRYALDREAALLAGTDLAQRQAMRDTLRNAVQRGGAAALVVRETAVPGLAGPRVTGPGATLGSLALLLWLLSLFFADGVLEMDAVRRRHPLWEWIFSHPVRPSAVFAAEMLAPAATNPAYWAALIVPWTLYAQAYGAGYGILAALLVGLPVAIATAMAGRAIEVAVLLRAAARLRGVLIGLMIWLQMAASMALGIAYLSTKTVGLALIPMLEWLPIPPHGLPWLGWFLGDWGGPPSFLLGVSFCLSASIAVAGAALASTAWSTARGLTGKVGRLDTRPARQAQFRGGYALFRKELAWFTRDRSVVIQVVLVPATMAAFEFFNLRRPLAQVTYGWHAPCAAGILFGTYFLIVAGSKSLASEGGALWLAMTWPQGMEALLRAKARFWAVLCSVPALAAMSYAAIMFPDEGWKVLLVAVGWCVFAWSLALKAVTLAQVTAESGEVEKIPAGPRWAVLLGTLSFTDGVLTGEIGPAVAGVVFSVVTAGAMWQNMRARLPYLLDPWSERLPRAPTLTHAVVAISLLLDLGVALYVFAVLSFGQQIAAVTMAVSYGLAAVAVSAGVVRFLRDRNVPLRTIWQCSVDEGGSARRQHPIGAWAPGLLAGVGAGLILGVFAIAYVVVLEHWPATSEAMHHARETSSAIPYAWPSLFVAAVLVAPAVEEFLFRGLLFRAMARDWPEWQAVAVSAACFASYHPVLSWLPVGLFGIACALLFRRTGRLANAVALHATYNAVVVGWDWLG